MLQQRQIASAKTLWKHLRINLLRQALFILCEEIIENSPILASEGRKNGIGQILVTMSQIQRRIHFANGLATFLKIDIALQALSEQHVIAMASIGCGTAHEWGAAECR